METKLVITPNEIRQTIANNEISQILLKDGTILKVTQNIKEQNQNNYILRNPSNQSQQNQVLYQGNSAINEQDRLLIRENEKQHTRHHRDGMGSFGQHFKTEYNEIYGDNLKGKGVLKHRKNYVLYVSKNCTEKNISRKNKHKTNNSKNFNLQQNQGTNGEKVVSQGYVECFDVPKLEPKVRLRNEQNINYLNPDKSQEQVQNINQFEKKLCPNCTAESLCPDCEGGEDINEGKLTTTVNVLVPDY